jgi:hypothetical protein
VPGVVLTSWCPAHRLLFSSPSVRLRASRDHREKIDNQPVPCTSPPPIPSTSIVWLRPLTLPHVPIISSQRHSPFHSPRTRRGSLHPTIAAKWSPTRPSSCSRRSWPRLRLGFVLASGMEMASMFPVSEQQRRIPVVALEMLGPSPRCRVLLERE